MPDADIASELSKSEGKQQELLHKLLTVTGNNLAKRELFTNIDGIEAIYLFLINKHHWTPSQVRSMTFEDLAFCVSAEEFD